MLPFSRLSSNLNIPYGTQIMGQIMGQAGCFIFIPVLWPACIWYLNYLKGFTIQSNLHLIQATQVQHIGNDRQAHKLSEHSPYHYYHLNINQKHQDHWKYSLGLANVPQVLPTAENPQRAGAEPLGCQGGGVVGKVWEWDRENQSAWGDGGWGGDSVTTCRDLWVSGKLPTLE